MTDNSPRFDNSYAHLPARFYSRLSPAAVSRPAPVRVNTELAGELGFDLNWLRGNEGTAMIAGNRLPDGADPIATVYAGHQFGSFNPQLGDGRAILLGEIVTGQGRRYDLQLKGSGPTPYSRGGDGRSPLGPVLREYILSEAMHALGVPTTRALAAVTTGEPVARDEMLPGAVLARVASSHLRIGTLQFFAARRDDEAVRLLTEYILERHYPEHADAPVPALALLEAVIARQAELIANWQMLGFIHGVMNTDNMLLCGETIDYGPCAFMEAYDPTTVFSSIDHGGRYAYNNQPAIAQWNLVQLAQSLLPLMSEKQEDAVELAQAAINQFPEVYQGAYDAGIARKFGLGSISGDDQLVTDWFELLSENRLDFTLSFRRLSDLADQTDAAGQSVAALFEFPETLQPWLARWHKRLAGDASGGINTSPADRQQQMYRANPVFIARNHLVQAAIEAAEARGDFGPFNQLVERLVDPGNFNHRDAQLAIPASATEAVHKTFCGT